MQKCLAIGCSLGTDSGAVGVECVGFSKGNRMRRLASVVASHRGHYIPVMPAVVMCARLAARDKGRGGIVPFTGWLNRDQLEAECLKRNYQLIVSESAGEDG